MASLLRSFAEKLNLSSERKPDGYKLLLVGETGSGKTAFLNFLCNSALIQALGHVDLNRLESFNNIALENPHAMKMESKTSAASLYEANICGVNIGIIDTPGFGDSRGLKQDKDNADMIVRCITSQEYINCICLVINGRLSRMNATLRYVLTEVTAILPKYAISNIVVVFSNCAEVLDLSFDPKSLEEFFGKPIDGNHMFVIENPYCRLEKAKEKQGSLPQDKVAESLKRSFETAIEMLTDFFKIVYEFGPMHTRPFEELHQKKEEIEESSLTLLTEYEHQKSLENEIKKAEKEVRAAANSKRLNSKYKTTRKVKRPITVKTDRHNTLCGAKGCHSNCHLPCYLPKSFDKKAFKDCAVMGGGTNCKECGHSYDVHYHSEVKFEFVTEEVDLIDHATRQQFEAAKDMEKAKDILLKGLKNRKQGSIEKRRVLSVKMNATIVEFERLGISRNYAKLLENQIAVIKQRLEGEPGDEASDLRQVLKELEGRLTVVRQAIKQTVK